MTAPLAELTREARGALGSIGRVHGGPAAPRFELFHAASSICSQKVRAVLAHHDLPYIDHELSIFAGQTYLPAYVRLRMTGCAHHGGALASHHSGSTSVTGGGCDGAVVPTLIDWQGEEVVIDSHRICLMLDEQMPAERRLRPNALATAIDEQMAVVDHLPNYQMLMGRTVDDAESAATRDGVGATLARRKVAWCDRYLADHPDDPLLVAAYTAKRSKEMSAAADLFGADAMRAAKGQAAFALATLDRRLAGLTTIWLHADTVTMSDLFWGIELLRMENIGAADLWRNGRLPHVERYAAATEQVPALRAAVVDWPGAMF